MNNITTLLVLRHGNTFNPGDTICRVGSRTDLPLTEVGKEQGKKVGLWLLEHKLIPAAVYFAPLLRTRQSAVSMLSALNINIPMYEDSLMTELDYGIDDGRPEEEVLERLGRMAGANGDHETCKQVGKKELERWDTEAKLPVGWSHLTEYVNSLPDKWKNFGSQIVKKHSGQLVVAVTSNGIARFSKGILPKETPVKKQLKLSTGAFGLYRFIDEQWQLCEWNLRP